MSSQAYQQIGLLLSIAWEKFVDQRHAERRRHDREAAR